MRRFFVVFAVFTALFFAVSCDDGVKKFNNPNDQNADITDSSDSQNDEGKDSTDTVADEDSNEQADTENDENSDLNDTTPDDADPTDDNADSADDEDTVDPDVTDTGETVGETRVADCTGLPENAGWNTVSAIVQTWNGEKWVPSSVASFNLEGSEDECRFKCDINYGWNGSNCSADIKNAYCDAKPENSVWNDGGRNGTFEQTWNGSAWTPANHAAAYSKSAVECGFVCATGYLWDGSECETAPTQTVECTGLPMNGAEWNTTSTITQTWDGEKWIPESTVGVYNENPSSEECRFKCKEHYSWKNSECAPDKKNSPCMNLPTNGQWNTVNSIEQTWSGTDWQPSTTGVYNETSSTKDCRFVCKTNYKWNASTSKCDPETNVENCTGKPANTVWNGSGKFEQTWTDSGWYPATYEATYNKTAGTCTFVCDTGFIWDETSCVSAPTREAGCQDKPANTVWNTVDKITQTYNGADWEPSTTPVYNAEASDRECRFKCASAEYTWNGTSCTSGGSSATPCDPNPCLGVANSTQECSVFGGTTYKCECNSGYYWDGTVCGTVQTQTAACTGLISNTEWNTVSEIIQKWDDYLGTWVPTATGSYNENPSTNQCRYKCKENYFFDSDSGKCVAKTITTDCADIPANASWNGSVKFYQTWTDSGWYPEYEPTYSKTPGICTFICNTNYIWSGSECKPFTNQDSDGDGDDDLAEIAYGSDPLDPASHIPAGIFYLVLPYNAPADVTRTLKFSTKIEAIDVAIFFDDSGSMGNEIAKLKEEVKDKVVGAIANEYATNPNYASFGLVRFGWETPYVVEQTMTYDADAVKNAIGNLKGNQGNELAIYAIYLAATGEAYTGSMLPCAMNQCKDPLLGVMHSAKYNVQKADCSAADKIGTAGALCMRKKSMPIFVVITDEDSDDCIPFGSQITLSTSCMFDVGTKELSKDLAIAGMNGIGAKFIGIDSGFNCGDNNNGGSSSGNCKKTDSAKEWFTAFAEATGSLDANGNPFLYHTEQADGTGIGGNITEAIKQLTTWINMDVTTGGISDDECNGVNAAEFVKSSKALSSDPDTIEHNDTTFFSVPQNAEVTFDVHFYNDFCVNSSNTFLKFDAHATVLGNGSYLSSHLINIIVP